MCDRILRRPEVEARVGIGRSTIYAWIANGDFPPPVKLGERLVGWRESDVKDWLASRELKVGGVG